MTVCIEERDDLKSDIHRQFEDFHYFYEGQIRIFVAFCNCERLLKTFVEMSRI